MNEAPPARPAVIGLAGGIGSGKSTVAAAFAALGCVVSDSDAQARACLERPEVIATLVEWWGPRVLDARGGIDRRAIGAIVFEDGEQRRRLEGLIHPLIREDRAALIERATRAGAPAVIVDAPLLFEVGLDRECDAVVFVDTDRAVRLERTRRTRGWDEAELTRREAAQWPVADKRARSGFVLDNNGDDPRALAREAARILSEIRRGIR